MMILHKPSASRSKRGAACQRGTTLVELVIALAVFLVIGAAAFNLFNVQQSSAITLQGQTGLSLALRNAASQLQLDLANAGDGYLEGLNIPNWPPIGIVLVNNWVVPGGTACNSGTTYSANCFDQINIIKAADSSVYPPIHATDSTGAAGTGNCSQTTAGKAYGQKAPISTSFPSGLTLAQTAALFHTGDEVMFLTNSGKILTTAVLTQNAAVSGSAVQFNFNATSSTGTNTAQYDPLGITTNALPTIGSAIQFGVQYCGPDWIIKLASVQYSVATNPDPNNPWQLVRQQNGGTQTVVMDQIIGFKVGAAIWNSYNSDFNSANYYYNASQYAITNTSGTSVAEPYNFNLVRAVRFSLIGRTTPNTDTVYTYRNTFDQGPYQVQGMAVVVNPRNLSMNDDSGVYMNQY